jgi:esterase/lipase
MSMSRAGNGRGRRSTTAAGILLFALLSGCASDGAVAPASELVSSGWSDPSALAPVGGFDAYVAAVTTELRVHRVPFDPSKAEAELASVAPFRMPPHPRCGPGKPRGIAILVHGLSDTAFAMRDLANSLARQCFEARALLLPGHGTRPADLMVVDENDWVRHVQAAVLQARRDNDVVVVAGFSLGAALAVTVAAEAPGSVDAVIGVSPAYRISSSLLARQASWLSVFRPWLDSGPREEFARYEAMPARGIASTMALLDRMNARVRAQGGVQVPWMVVQSEDDEVIDVTGNRRFFASKADDPRSVFLNYVSEPTGDRADERVTWLPAADPGSRVAGLSHLALHIAPENPHYGLEGAYRNCGSAPFREESEVQVCRQAEQVWYGTGRQSPPPGEAGARATFNPHYPDLERRIGGFLAEIDGRHADRSASLQEGTGLGSHAQSSTRRR